MPASIINTTLNAGGKILRKTTRSTSDDGLVVLVENYTIRLADIGSLEPDAGTTHSSFSTASTKYTRMQVETTAVNPIDGDLADLVVTYVGLDYATGLPPAYITAVGQPGAGVFGADASVVARYITAQPVFDLLKGASPTLSFSGFNFISNLTLPTKRLIPASINGTAMPPNPRAREYRAIRFGFAGTSFREWLYAGYVQTSISFQRRGSFNQIEEQFTEHFAGSSDMFTASGTVDLQSVNSLASSGFFF